MTDAQRATDSLQLPQQCSVIVQHPEATVLVVVVDTLSAGIVAVFTMFTEVDVGVAGATFSTSEYAGGGTPDSSFG